MSFRELYFVNGKRKLELGGCWRAAKVDNGLLVCLDLTRCANLPMKLFWKLGKPLAIDAASPIWADWLGCNENSNKFTAIWQIWMITRSLRDGNLHRKWLNVMRLFHVPSSPYHAKKTPLLMGLSFKKTLEAPEIRARRAPGDLQGSGSGNGSNSWQILISQTLRWNWLDQAGLELSSV